MAVGMRIFAVILLGGVALGQTANPAKRLAKKPLSTTPVPAAISAQPAAEIPRPAVSLRPSQMPAVPPRVSLDNGALTIVAENSTMADVLTQLRAATGIKIETLGGPSGERIAARIGPAPVRDVILSLVQGSGYDFIILGVEGRPDAVERLILTPKASSGAVTASSPQRSYSGTNAVYSAPQPEPSDDDDNEGFAPAPTPMAQPNPSEQNAAPGNVPPNPGQPRTPEQLLEELRRMEEQRNNPRPQRPPR
jgi:hypothetical protein